MAVEKPSIVAIDDEPDFVDTLKEYFELRGYRIKIASRVGPGIDLIGSEKPDIVILDLKMPGINGEEVLNILRSKKLKTKVIFVSAFEDAGKTKSRMLAAGAFAYMDKPLKSIKDLEDTVNKAYSEK